MDRSIFEPEHALFRDTVRHFMRSHVAPQADGQASADEGSASNGLKAKTSFGPFPLRSQLPAKIDFFNTICQIPPVVTCLVECEG